MHRFVVLIAATLILTVGGFALTDAQNADDAGTSGACGTPDASPAASTPATMATPEGTPSADPCATPGGDASGAVEVNIVNYTYDPDPVEIPTGGTITWTNQDTVPHTSTGRDKDVLQTGTLQQGDSASVTFDTAGTIEYYCEFHANMKGTIVVQ